MILMCFVMLYMIIMVFLMVVLVFNMSDGVPHWISYQELGTAFAAREEEIEDELLEPAPLEP